MEGALAWRRLKGPQMTRLILIRHGDAAADDDADDPSVDRQSSYSASQLAWFTDVPAHERDINGADLA
jgi:hypothetical protein